MGYDIEEQGHALGSRGLWVLLTIVAAIVFGLLMPPLGLLMAIVSAPLRIYLEHKEKNDNERMSVRSSMRDRLEEERRLQKRTLSENDKLKRENEDLRRKSEEL